MAATYHRPMRLLIALVLAVTLSACGSQADTDEADSTPETSATPEVPKATETAICQLLTSEVDDAGGFSPLDGTISFISTTPGKKPTKAQYQTLLDRLDDITPRADGEIGEQLTTYTEQSHDWVDDEASFDSTTFQAAAYDLTDRCVGPL